MAKKKKTYTFREACNAVMDDEPFEGVVELDEDDLYGLLAEGVWEDSKFWSKISIEELDSPVKVHFEFNKDRMKENGYE